MRHCNPAFKSELRVRKSKKKKKSMVRITNRSTFWRNINARASYSSSGNLQINSLEEDYPIANTDFSPAIAL